MPGPGAILGRWVAQKLTDSLSDRKINKKKGLVPTNQNKAPPIHIHGYDDDFQWLIQADLSDLERKKEVEEYLTNLFTNDSTSLTFLADACIRMSFKLPNALLCADLATKIDPNSLIAWNTLGIVLAFQQKFPLAIHSFQMALAIDPTNEAIKKNLSNVSVGNIDFLYHRFGFTKDIHSSPS